MKWIFLSLVLSEPCLSFAYASPEIKLCYEDVTVFPWIIGDTGGLVISELHMVEKRLNIKFNLIRLPWKRCQTEAQAGNFDGIIAASYTQDREEWGIYPTQNDLTIERDYRLHTDAFYVYIRKDSSIKWVNKQLINLKEQPVGVQLGYSVGKDLEKAGYSIHASLTTAYDILKEMDFNTLKVAVLQNYESTKTLNEHPKLKQNIIRLKEPYKVADQYLLFTKDFYGKNKDLSKSIWRTIPKARNSREYLKAQKSLMALLDN
ncbi:MAG: transporter substrate-binding domain-containing protein [Bacteriovorax sp.]|nr:transporter substrate-binding domain-containing protein [Bacteriovorax sp.]